MNGTTAKVLRVGYNGANNTGAEALLLSDIRTFGRFSVRRRASPCRAQKEWPRAVEGMVGLAVVDYNLFPRRGEAVGKEAGLLQVALLLLPLPSPPGGEGRSSLQATPGWRTGSSPNGGHPSLSSPWKR